MKRIIVHTCRGMFFLSLLFLLIGCGLFPGIVNIQGAFSPKAAKEPEDFVAVLWNVQALFGGKEAGNEYAEFREAAGWTAEKYQARITAISNAILKMEKSEKAENTKPSNAAKVPDLIGFVEIENAGVLDDLAGGSLAKYGYNWTAFSNLPGSSLGIGVLSRFPIKETRAHSITTGKETAPRPVLEIRVEPRGKPVVFLLCHWKSKLGRDTEALRRASARVVQRRLRELKKTEAETPVIIMGDLNENYDEYYRHAAELFCALLPDDPDTAVLSAQASSETGVSVGFLVLSTEKPPRSRYLESVPALYSPWGEEMSGGSYYYKGNWETIDHFLLSEGLFSGSGWDFAGCRVLNQEPFTTSKGTPNTYVPRNGRGLSDHLPLLLYLRDLTGE